MNAAAPASRTEIGVVYSAAVVQGLCLVTFPAASSVFTSPDGFGFDSTRYGTMFVPQVVLAILSSGLGPRLARRWSLRRVLLVATGALGLGFGATVMAMNTYAEAFFPGRADAAVLALNALLGLGTALAPVLVAIVVGLGAWWLLPVVVAFIMMLIFGVGLAEPLSAAAAGAPASIGLRNLPDRFWFYAAAVFLYGILETLNGNWVKLYLSVERGVSAQGASFALAAFWAMVTVGRVLIAVISRAVPSRWIYLALPIVLFIVFQASARVQDETEGIIVFGL